MGGDSEKPMLEQEQYTSNESPNIQLLGARRTMPWDHYGGSTLTSRKKKVCEHEGDKSITSCAKQD